MGKVVNFKPSASQQAQELMDLGKKHGIQLGIGMACDALTACQREKEAKGDGSAGYWEALLDMHHKLHELLKANK